MKFNSFGVGSSKFSKIAIINSLIKFFACFKISNQKQIIIIIAKG